MKRNNTRTVTSAAVAVISLISLVGCSLIGAGAPAEPSGSTPSEASPSSDPPEPSASTTAPATDEPITLPGCDVIDLAAVENSEGLEVGPYTYEFPYDSLGPAARAAFDEAEQQRFCWVWLPNSEYGVIMVLTELPADAKDEFVAALEGSLYAERVVEGLRTFSYLDVQSADGFSAYNQLHYMFADTVMVSEHTGGMGNPESVHGPTAFTLQLADAVLVANPQLSQRR